MSTSIRELFARGGLSLDRLRVLLEVANAGGIAKAVGDDPVRQSQYSRQLKELEDFFEVELTRRQGKSLVMTPAGERLARIVRESFSTIGQFASDCRKEPATFNIGAGDSLIQWLAIPRLGSLQKALPTISLNFSNLRTADIVRDLHELKLDFGIIRHDAVPTTLNSKPLGKLKYALYVPKALVPKESKLHTLKWFMANVPLALQTSSGEFDRLLREATSKASINLRTRLQCPSFPIACRAVATGQYAAVLPTLARRDLPSELFLEVHSPLFKDETRTIAVAWNPRTLRLRTIAGDFLTWLESDLRFD